MSHIAAKCAEPISRASSKARWAWSSASSSSPRRSEVTLQTVEVCMNIGAEPRRWASARAIAWAAAAFSNCSVHVSARAAPS